jgi:hypothetical protein
LIELNPAFSLLSVSLPTREAVLRSVESYGLEGGSTLGESTTLLKIIIIINNSNRTNTKAPLNF